MKREVLFAVIFGMIAGFITFLFETMLHVDNTYVTIFVMVLFIAIGYRLGMWTKKKK